MLYTIIFQGSKERNLRMKNTGSLNVRFLGLCAQKTISLFDDSACYGGEADVLMRHNDQIYTIASNPYYHCKPIRSRPNKNRRKLNRNKAENDTQRKGDRNRIEVYEVQSRY